MDVDGTESQPKRVSDFGVEVDFSSLSQEDRTVSVTPFLHMLSGNLSYCYYFRTPPGSE